MGQCSSEGCDQKLTKILEGVRVSTSYDVRFDYGFLEMILNA
jgi:hypothetical protein